jgi:hypothetical protein
LEYTASNPSFNFQSSNTIEASPTTTFTATPFFITPKYNGRSAEAEQLSLVVIGVNGACRLTHHAEAARRLLFLLVLLCRLLLLRLLRESLISDYLFSNCLSTL